MSGDIDDIEFDDSDDFNFDDEMGFEAGEGEPVKDDRNPVTKSRDAAIESIGDELRNTDRMVDTIKENLPSGYQAAVRSADSVVKETKNLYDDAVKELKPTLIQLKKNTKRLLPALKNVMPESLGNKIESMLSEDDSIQAAADAAKQGDDAAISGSLGAIFQAQAQQGDQDKQTEVVRTTMRQNVEDAQTKAGLNLNVDIANQLARLNAFNDDIQSKVSRQSLELQFRSYFALRDLLTISTRTADDTVTKLAEIVKNTALPDIVKFQQSEVFMQQYKDKMYGDAIKKAEPFIDRLKANVLGKVKDKLGSVKSSFEEGVEMTGSIAEGMEMAEEAGMEISPAEMAGQAVAGNVMNRAFKFAGEKFGSLMRKNDRVMALSNTMDRFSNDPEGMFRLIANADDDTELFGIKVNDNPVLSMIKKGMAVIDPGTVSQVDDVQINANQAATLLDPAIYDNMTRKSIVEIIPEYLSRILSETTRFNGGDADRLVFDPSKGRLTKLSDAITAAQATMSNVKNSESTGDSIREVVDLIDSDEVLSRNDRVAFGLFLREQSLAGSAFDPLTIKKEIENYSWADSDVQSRISEMFEANMGFSEDGKVSLSAASTAKVKKVGRGFSELRKHSNENQNKALQYTQSGSLGILDEAGLLSDEASGYRWNMDRENGLLDKSISERLYRNKADANVKFRGTVLGKAFGGDAGNDFRMSSTVNRPAGLFADADAYASDMMGNFNDNITFPKGQRDEIVRPNIDLSKRATFATDYVAPAPAVPQPVQVKQKPLGLRAPGNQGGFVGANTPMSPVAATPAVQQMDDKGIIAAIAESTTAINAIPESVYVLFAKNGKAEKVDDAKPPILNVEPDPRMDTAIQLMQESNATTVKSNDTTNTLLGSILDINTRGFKELVETMATGLLVADMADIAKRSFLGKALGSMGKGIFGLAKGATGKALGAVKMTAGVAVSATKLTARILASPVTALYSGDIYSKSSGQPVLFKARLKEGKYFRPGQLDKPITSFSAKNIGKGVVDAKGNYVLTPETLAEGITRVNGKAILAKGGKAIGWIADKLTFGLLSKTGKVLGDLKGFIGRRITGVTDFIKSQGNRDLRTDLYIGEETEPRLSLVKLKAGEYRTEDGKVLTDFGLIAGVIKDSSGNVVLSIEDTKLLRDVNGKPLRPKGLLGVAGKAIMAPFKIALKPFVFIKGRVTATIEQEFRTDLYVKGGKKPVLVFKDLKDGKYYDANTGKPLTSFSRIRGAVKDQSGVIVLSAEDFESGLYRADGTRFKALGMMGRAMKGLKAIVAAPFKPVVWMKNKLTGAKAKHLDVDIYVPGRKRAALLQTSLKAGKYYDQRSGRVITNFAEIRGTVVYKSGKVALSMDDIEAGLVDQHGERLKLIGGLSKLVNGLKKVAGAPIRAVKWLGGKVKDSLSRLKDVMGFGPKGALSGLVNSISTALVTKIKAMSVKADVVNLYTRDGLVTVGKKGKLTSKKKAALDDLTKSTVGREVSSMMDDVRKFFTKERKAKRTFKDRISDFKKKMKESIRSKTKGLMKRMFGKGSKIGNLGRGMKLKYLKGSRGLSNLSKGFGKRKDAFTKGVSDRYDGASKYVTDGYGNVTKSIGSGASIVKGAAVTGYDTVTGAVKGGVGTVVDGVKGLAPTKRSFGISTIRNMRARNLLKGKQRIVDDRIEAERLARDGPDATMGERLSAKYNTMRFKQKGRKVNRERAKAEVKTSSIDTGPSKWDALKAFMTTDRSLPSIALPKRKAKDAGKVSLVKGSKARKVGDADGDGLRDGGFRAKFKSALADRKAAKLAKAAEGTKDLTRATNVELKKQTKLSAKSAKRSGKVLDVLYDIKRAIYIMAGKSAMGGLGDMLPGGRKGGKRGLLGKAGSFLKKGAMIGLGGIGSMFSGVAAAASTAASYAGAAVAAVGAGTVAAVAIGAVAVGAVGYLGWQYYKSEQRKRPVTPIERVRFAQYGVDYDNPELLYAIRYLEDELEGDVSGESIDVDIISAVEDYASDFLIGEDDLAAKQQFAVWMAKRFLPVFATWQRATEARDTDTRDMDDDLATAEQISLAKLTVHPASGVEDPYRVLTPWDRTLTRDDVMEAIRGLEMSPTTEGRKRKDAGPSTVKVTDGTPVAQAEENRTRVQRTIAAKRTTLALDRAKAGQRPTGDLPMALKAGATTSTLEEIDVLANTVVDRKPNVPVRMNLQDQIRAAESAQAKAQTIQQVEENRKTREQSGLLTGQLRVQQSMNMNLKGLLQEMRALRTEAKTNSERPIQVTTTVEAPEGKAPVVKQVTVTKPSTDRELSFPINTGKSNLQLGGG